MHRGRILVALSVLLIFSLFPPVHAISSPDNTMMRDAENLNMTVPPMAAAPLGTQESMTGMLDWLNACSRALIAFFNDTMNLLGLSNASYVTDMNRAVAPAMKNPPAVSR